MSFVLDTSGQRCPLPLLRAKQRMRALRPGDRLVVIATDPEAHVDFGAWAAVTGYELSTQAVGSRIELTVVKR
ncbi:MAG: sulfurtransferase TusA family protein [Conexibacter sp.]